MRIAEFKLKFSIPQSEFLNGIVMEQEDLKQRTKEFALRIIKLVEVLPKERTTDVEKQ